VPGYIFLINHDQGKENQGAQSQNSASISGRYRPGISGRLSFKSARRCNEGQIFGVEQLLMWIKVTLTFEKIVFVAIHYSRYQLFYLRSTVWLTGLAFGVHRHPSNSLIVF
jgi:hypothetical protein